MTKKLDLIGQRFGRLVVIAEAAPRRFASGNTHRCVSVRCDCGATQTATVADLRSNHKQSCGCYRRDFTAEEKTSHGHRRNRTATSEYGIWNAMIARCERPASKSFQEYGGRGIKVCVRWRRSFSGFLADMGPRPSADHSIDRIDNDGNYEPSNCRWATDAEQRANKRRNGPRPRQR